MYFYKSIRIIENKSSYQNFNWREGQDMYL